MTVVTCGACGATYTLASVFELEGPCRECGEEEALLEDGTYDPAPAVLICVGCRREVDGGPAGAREDADFQGRYSVEDPCPICRSELVPLDEAPAARAQPQAAKARAAARQWRQRHSVSGPWIDLEALIRAEGLEIVRRSGIDEPYLSDGVIYTPSGAARGSERFGLAHELGHHLLGHLVPESALEIEANAFAAELLMPATEIRRLLDSPQTIAALARRFQVSREAMTRSLTYNKLIGKVALA